MLQLHICWNFSITSFPCVTEKTCDAQTTRENTNEMRLASISCMTEVVCLACLPIRVCNCNTFFSWIGVPRSLTSIMPDFLHGIEELVKDKENSIIIEHGISNSTLEEVFMNITQTVS